MFINKTPLDCKQLFRNSLDDMITKMKYVDKVSIIRYLSWNKNSTNDLEMIYLNDGIHLNEVGYARLDSCIAETCMKHYYGNQYGNN